MKGLVGKNEIFARLCKAEGVGKRPHKPPVQNCSTKQLKKV